jgi:3',5'-cyclic AMP phosphodiesterase CpdA
VRRIAATAFLTLLALLLAAQAPDPSFVFAIVGDRTGFAQPGVYQHVWRDIDRLRPAFAINVGDSIQGGDDATAAGEWEEIAMLFHRKLPFYAVPGNHDIWSAESERLFRAVTGRPTHYSFDYLGAHFTVLDNSRSTALSPGQMRFLEQDLAAHKAAKPKVIFFHQPFWLTAVMFRNPDFALHRLAKRYSATIVSGHVHRFGYWNFDGVEYLLVGSSGGQLRGDRFSDGWFFHWIEAVVSNGLVEFIVHELPEPDGEGRVFSASEWNSVKLN